MEWGWEYGLNREVKSPRNFDNSRIDRSGISSDCLQRFRIFLSFSPGKISVRFLNLLISPEILSPELAPNGISRSLL